jgi:uroporphyrinogen-III synthase
LTKNNINVQEIECYKTSFTPRKIENKYRGILFYSPSGIESFLKENTAGDTTVFCIGETTAAAAKKYFKNVIVAELPTVESLIKSVNQYFENE